MLRWAFRRVLRGAFKKKESRIFVVQNSLYKTPLRYWGRDYFSIGGFHPCRDGTCTLHFLKANMIRTN